MTEGAPPPAMKKAPLLRPELQFILCALGIYSCYLYYGVLQERIYKTPHGATGAKFTFSALLLTAQTLTNALCALLFLLATRTPLASANGKANVHLGDYFSVSLSYLLAMWFSFTALRHMSYPMQALGKSCKLIPVMLMGILIRRRRHPPRDFVCVLLISAGVALFSWKSGKSSTPTSPLGVVLLLLSLFMDGVTGPLQERLVARHNPSTHQLMFWQNLVACAICACMSAVTEGAAAPAFVARHPAVVRDIAAFAVMSALGQNFIFYTVRNFSALAVTTITTTRKMFTILLSIVLFNHRMVARQWVGLVLVFLAIAWNTLAKSRERERARKEALAAGKDADGKKVTKTN